MREEAVTKTEKLHYSAASMKTNSSNEYSVITTSSRHSSASAARK